MREGEGLFAHLLSSVLRALSFAVRAAPDLTSDATEAILARAEYHLERGDVERATEEVVRLTGWPHRLARDWLREARVRLEAQQAIDVLHACACLMTTQPLP